MSTTAITTTDTPNTHTHTHTHTHTVSQVNQTNKPKVSSILDSMYYISKCGKDKGYAANCGFSRTEGFLEY